MTAELQRASDMLASMQQQRDTALNGLVHLNADKAALERRVAELEKIVADFECKQDKAAPAKQNRRRRP